MFAPHTNIDVSFFGCCMVRFYKRYMSNGVGDIPNHTASGKVSLRVGYVIVFWGVLNKLIKKIRNNEVHINKDFCFSKFVLTFLKGII